MNPFQKRQNKELQNTAHHMAVSKGWWDQFTTVEDGVCLTTHEVLGMLMLITTEVAEAAEDVREDKMSTTIREDGKPEGFPSELADIVIRCMDLAGALGVDLFEEIDMKMAFNATRQQKHGGKLA